MASGALGERIAAYRRRRGLRLSGGLLGRRAQIQLDLAWAQSQRKRDAEAALHLLDAERERLKPSGTK